MASGALYTLLRPLLPRLSAAAGPAYGGALWAANYLGLMPALGLYPWPKEDRRGRSVVMIIAHTIYGVVLIASDRSLAIRHRRTMADRGRPVILEGLRSMRQLRRAA